MNVFYVSALHWFHSVPVGSTWKHPRWCLLWQQLFVILYAFGQCYCTHSFFLFCVNWLLGLSRSRWLHLFPGGSNSFQVVVLTSSSWFEVVPTYISLFLVSVRTLQDMYAAILLFLKVEIIVVVSVLFHLNETRFSKSYFNNRQIDYLHL